MAKGKAKRKVRMHVDAEHDKNVLQQETVA